MIAVICGQPYEFREWARENPEQSGWTGIDSAALHTPQAIGITRLDALRGLTIDGVFRIGSWRSLSELEQIEAYIPMALRR